MTAREAAFQMLYRTLENGEYSHIIINKVFAEAGNMDKRERALAAAVFSGTIERKMTIDYIIDVFSKTKTVKLKPNIRTILRMSVYQLVFMDTSSDYAVCNEAVKLVKKHGPAGLSGYVNGVLREISRNKDRIDSIINDDSQKEHYFQVKYSMPEWIAEYLTGRYGKETAEKVCRAFLENKKTYVRCNLSKAGIDEIKEKLRNDGADVSDAPYFSDALCISGFDSVGSLKAFKEGLIQVQDISSMFVGNVAGIKKDDFVIDVCAAPGGKSMHAAEIIARLNGSGCVYSRDVSEAKVRMIADNAERNGYSHVHAEVKDATEAVDKSEAEKYDVLICDVPCSGIGIIGRKPDIKYQMSREQQDELVKLQRKITDNVVKLVKPGGVMIYSTCTINEHENESNVRYICEQHGFRTDSLNRYLPEELWSDTTEKGWLQLLPGVHHSDGFFVARLIKEK